MAKPPPRGRLGGTSVCTDPSKASSPVASRCLASSTCSAPASVAPYSSFVTPACQAYLGRTLSPYRQDFTALIGQAGESVNGIYEADYRDFNRETYARGRATFDETYAAFKTLLMGIWRRDELSDQQAAE